MTTRTRSPYMIARPGVGSYQFEDTLDACTPGELSKASWSLMLQQALQDPAWLECTSRTFFISTQERVDPSEFFQVPKSRPHLRIFCRRVVEGRVVRRAWGYLIGNLPDKAAYSLPMLLSLGPVFHMSNSGWDARVIPATGASGHANMLSVNEVAAACGFEFELEARSDQKAIISAYGFNPIPQFRRLFEMRLEPPFPGMFR